MSIHIEIAEAPTFDIRQVESAYAAIRQRVQPGESNRNGDVIRTISLTHRPGATDPFYDGNQSQFDQLGRKVYREDLFTVFNEELRDTYFWTVYRSLPFRIGRMRLIVLPPATIYRMHRDATKRAHLAITTNPDCRLTWRDGNSFHVPADGSVYVTDTTIEHTAYNAGRSERVHLVMSMVETEGQ